MYEGYVYGIIAYQMCLLKAFMKQGETLMSVEVQKLEKNMAKLTVTVDAKEFDKAIADSFKKNKNRFNVPGFRKGHVTQDVFEKMYGADSLIADAIDFVLDASYPSAARESELEIVSRPQIEIKNAKKGEDFVYEALIAVRPEVELGEYRGIEVKKADEVVNDDDIASALKSEQEKNARLITVEGRPVENGDNITLDFEGKIDGVAFDGGKGEDYPLVVGSGTFIPGFEDQIIGHNAGEDFDVNITFPENYQMKDLAGNAAVFACKVKEIQKKELPELDDDFASEISEFDTMDEYKEDLRKQLSEAKAKRAATENENSIVDKLIETSTMDIPDPMVDAQVEGLVADYGRRMQSQGITLDQYLQITGMSKADLNNQFKPQALKQIKTRLVLEEVAKKENIQVSEDEINAELQKIADSYKMELEKIKGFFGENERKQMSDDLAVQKAIDFLVENAKLV